MSYVLNNVTTGGAYTPQATLTGGAIVALRVTVANAAVYMQVGRGVGGVNWEAEQYLVPGVYGLDRDCDAVRFRSATPGIAATVSVDAQTAFDRGDG